MDHDHAQALLEQTALTTSAMERVASELRMQSQAMAREARETQDMLRTVHMHESEAFRQGLTTLMQHMQRQSEDVLRVARRRAWLTLAAVGGTIVVLSLVGLMLLHYESGRLQEVRGQADAAELRADVLAASRHVEIASCGGRPCIRIDRATPLWTSPRADYVLVDGVADTGQP